MTTQNQLAGKSGCPECGGGGWKLVYPEQKLWRICACTGSEVPGVFTEQQKRRIEVRARETLQLAEMQETLETLIRRTRCPVNEDADRERQFLSALARAWGESNAVPREQIERETGLDERAVKKMVEHLVLVHRLGDDGLVLGRSRGRSHGYFWCLTADEAMNSYAAYIQQALTMLLNASIAVGRFGDLRTKLRPAILELEGQLSLWGRRSDSPQSAQRGAA